MTYHYLKISIHIYMANLICSFFTSHCFISGRRKPVRKIILFTARRHVLYNLWMCIAYLLQYIILVSINYAILCALIYIYVHELIMKKCYEVVRCIARRKHAFLDLYFELTTTTTATIV